MRIEGMAPNMNSVDRFISNVWQWQRRICSVMLEITGLTL